MKRVGIVSCDKWKEIIKEDIDLRLQLLKEGIEADIISWEDKNLDYSNYDCLVLRSVWGYQKKYYDFKNWLLFLKENNIKIYNSVDIILNNIRKDIQFSILDKYSIPHISTQFQKNKIDINNIPTNSVLKPIISGSGENTFVLSTDGKLENKINFNQIDEHFKHIITEEDNGLIIQPFISDVKNGEYASVFIDGINTHNMIRYPGVFYDKKKPEYIQDIPSEVIDLALKVNCVPEYRECLYMRVDIVMVSGKPMIMEVELSEPDLLTKYIADEEKRNDSIKVLAKSLERRI